MSKIRARSGASGLPRGGGTFCTICSMMSGTPTPVLPLHEMASSHERPMICSIWSLVPSTSDEGKSTLLSTGRISRP